MPILEAMACATTCIVPNFGACLDFCFSSNSFRVPVSRINLPVTGDFTINTLGFKESIEEVDFCEVNPRTLADYLRKAFNASKKVIYDKSRSSYLTAHRNFTWSDTARYIKEELESLDSYERPFRYRASKIRKKNARSFMAAKELLLNEI